MFRIYYLLTNLVCKILVLQTNYFLVVEILRLCLQKQNRYAISTNTINHFRQHCRRIEYQHRIFNFTLKDNRDDNKTPYDKLHLISRYIEKQCAVGTIDSPREYFKGTIFSFGYLNQHFKYAYNQ